MKISTKISFCLLTNVIVNAISIKRASTSISFALVVITLPRALDAVAVETKGKTSLPAKSSDLELPGSPGSASLLLESTLEAPVVDKEEAVFTKAVREWASALQKWLPSGREQHAPEDSSADFSKSGATFLPAAPIRHGSLLHLGDRNATGAVQASSADRPSRTEWNSSDPAAIALQAKVRNLCIILALTIFVFGYGVIFYNHHYERHPRRHSAFLIQNEEPLSESDLSARFTEEELKAREEKEQAKMTSAASVSNVYGKHQAVESDDLVDRCGISGFSVLPGDGTSGVTKMTYRQAVPLICLQACILQIGLLFFLNTQLVPQSISKRPHLPMFIVFIAIYLHFLKCVQELPFVWQIFQHIHDFHQDTYDLLIFGGVLIMDAFVVPLLSLVLGAFYLCASRSIGDIILNACAVAFIHEVDNWILDLLHRVNFIAGKISPQVAHIPINKDAMFKFAWYIIFIPVVPCVATVLFIYVGYYVLRI